MLRAFRNCGLLSYKHLKENLTMADRRILNFQRDGYIEKAHLLNSKTKEMEPVFRLTEKGRNLVESQLNLQHCYLSASGRHDIAIAEKYFSLSEVEQVSWKTEGELREIIHSRAEASGRIQSIRLQDAYQNKKISTTDAAYRSKDGRLVAVEVVTRNYSNAEIQAKETFAQILDMDFEVIKI